VTSPLTRQTAPTELLPFVERKENIVRLTDGFDVWWAGLSEETRSRIDKATARRAYVAGFRRSTEPELKRFQFYAGRRKVTVSARTLNDAKERAKAVLDARVIAAGQKPPRQGWSFNDAPPLD